MTVLIFLIAVVCLATLAWTDFRRAMVVFTALLPTYLLRFQVGPLPTTLLEVLWAVLMIVWVVRRFARVGAENFLPLRPERLRPWLIPCGLLIAAGIIGVIVAPDTRAALGLFRAYLLEPVLFFALLTSIADATLMRRMSQALVVSGTAIAIVALAQQALGPAYLWEAVRSTSVYPFPNAVGLFLAPIVVLAVGMITVSRGVARLAPALIAALVMFAAIIAAQSEGAIIGVAAGLFMLGVLQKKTRVPTLIVTVVIAALVLVVPPARNLAYEKLLLHDWSGTVRRITWDETLAMLRDRPLFGAGLSGYPIVMRAYHKTTAIEIFQYPHDLLLNVWSELGLLGVVAFGWILVMFVRVGVGLAPTQTEGDRKGRPYAIVATAAMVALLVHGLVDVPYFKNDLSFLFWIIVALGTVGALPTAKNRLS